MKHSFHYNRDKDPFIYGFIGGLLGTLADEVIHWSAVYSGFANSTTGHYISQLIFPHQTVVLPKLLLGELTHNIAGGILGIFMAFIFYCFGFRYALIKGIGLGIALWILHVAIIPNLVTPRPYVYRTLNEALADMVAHIVWGFITALFLVWKAKAPAKKPHKRTLLRFHQKKHS